MRRPLVAALTAALIALPVYAALPDGTKAPDFSTEASLAGKSFKFSLAEALKKGPVVLYFYPAAFTPGCTVEAHQFAEATDKFKALGATVIGVSHDPIDKLNKFSVSECRNKFAVGLGCGRRHHEGVRLGAREPPGVCQPHLLRDRPDRGDHLFVHGHESRQARRRTRWRP